MVEYYRPPLAQVQYITKKSPPVMQCNTKNHSHKIQMQNQKQMQPIIVSNI